VIARRRLVIAPILHAPRRGLLNPETASSQAGIDTSPAEALNAV